MKNIFIVGLINCSWLLTTGVAIAESQNKCDQIFFAEPNMFVSPPPILVKLIEKKIKPEMFFTTTDWKLIGFTKCPNGKSDYTLCYPTGAYSTKAYPNSTVILNGGFKDNFVGFYDGDLFKEISFVSSASRKLNPREAVEMMVKESGLPLNNMTQKNIDDMAMASDTVSGIFPTTEARYLIKGKYIQVTSIIYLFKNSSASDSFPWSTHIEYKFRDMSWFMAEKEKCKKNNGKSNYLDEIEKERRRRESSRTPVQRTGAFEFYAGSPKRSYGATQWDGRCIEGGRGGVFENDAQPNIFCWNGYDFDGASSGCKPGIGPDQAMRKACGG